MMWPKQISQAPTALMLTKAEAALQQAGGTWSQMFDENAPQNRSQVLSVVVWLLALELLGLIAFPLAFVALRGLADRGYGVSKTLGVLLLAWLSWIGPSLKLVPYQRWWIMLCLGLLIGASGAVAWRRRTKLVRFIREHAALLLTEEAIFLVLFGLFLLIRAGNPDLWHPARGGEKPMEFAYLNAVIRSTTFPPFDPWHAGGFMNYYYFGWVMIGTLIKLTGIVPWVAYNLAVPTLFALTGAGAFSVAFSLADGDRATEFPGEEAPTGGLRIGSLLAGLAGVFFVTIIGNLGNARLLFDQIIQRSTAGVAGTGALSGLLNFLSGAVAVVSGKSPLQFPNDWWFWNASRVIPDTINEFPFFTFTYADLHAHMLALPLTLLALAAAVALVRNAGVRSQGSGVRGQGSEGRSTGDRQSMREPSPWHIALADLLPIVLLGFVLGALRATNTWDFPTYALAGLAALVVVEAVRRSRMGWPQAESDGSPLLARLAFLFRAVVAVIWRAVILVGVATVTFYPFTKYYATAYAGVEMYKDARTQIPDFLIVHGFFLAMAVIWLAGELYEQIRERETPSWLRALVPWLVAAAVVLVGAGWVLHIRVWLIAVPLLVTALVLALGRDLPPTRRYALILLALALAIVMGVELVRQKDDHRPDEHGVQVLPAGLDAVRRDDGLRSGDLGATCAELAAGLAPAGLGGHRRAARPGDALPGLRGAGQGQRSLLGRGVAARAGWHGLYGQRRRVRERRRCAPGGRQGRDAVAAYQRPGFAGDPGGPDPGIPLGQPVQRLHRPADRAGLELASAPAALRRAQHRGRAPRE